MDTISSLRKEIRILRKENRRLIDSIRKLELDGLTGLPNRTAGERMLEAEINRSLRSKSLLYISAVFVDLNNLKYFNDRYGHSAGDSLIKAVAEAIIETKRDYDIAYRFGGDEFIIVLPDLNNTMAKRFIKRLSAALDRKCITPNRSGNAEMVSAAIGLSTISNRDFESVKAAIRELIGGADRSMYIDKNRIKGLRKDRG